MAKDGNFWNRIMKAALAIPGVSLDREEYLRSTLKDACTEEELQKVLEYRPAVVLSREDIDGFAADVITFHTSAVTTLSTITGLPGGPIILASIPADLAQYYYHVFILAQKLAYLYGFPDLRDDNKELTDDSAGMLTLFVGVMMGAQLANGVLRDIAKDLALQVAKKMPQKVLAKTLYYPILSQVAKRIGADLSKSSFTKTFGKFIPLLGGIVSGTVTYITFSNGAKRLQKALHRQMDLLGNDITTVSSETGEIYVADEAVERLAMEALINMALMDDQATAKKREYLKQQISHTSLGEEEQASLLSSFDEEKTFKVDFSTFKEDPVCSTQLMRRLTDIIRLTEKVSVSAKIYLNKISRELGYSVSDVEEFLADR